DELERNANTHPSLYEEWDTDLDYVLALSLQNENNPPKNTKAGISNDFWESYYTKEAVPSPRLHQMDKSNTIMLPCEFCEELYPAEDLILHQTGCNPASAFASFSKRRSSPTPREHDGLPAAGSRSCRSLSSSQPQDIQADGDIMIPCEFCGVQLEEQMLFHHQHQCDLRPASPAATFPPPRALHPQAPQERRDSPEVTRRRTRHQGG
ncbi:TRAD1 protein, partial [Brachypteracias leptosomus]|nr:TRAD1 protein [Brachypteracias leptosomus]